MDGSSAMRRTASLSLFAEEEKNNLANVDHLFSINKKCKLELGIKNIVPEYIFYQENDIGNLEVKTINYQSLYGDIVWFPLGIYVMFNPSIAHSMTGVTISMQLKDKMCLLNGDLGGQIHSSVEFNYKDEQVDVDSISIKKKDVLIYDIIKELVNHWGNEQLSKIIISEVPLRIKSALRWVGQNPIYLVQIPNNFTLVTDEQEAEDLAKAYGIEDIKKIEQYYDAGFIYTSFVYPLSNPLSCNAGETVTSVLDKIINIIGNYEYFYDVEGNFIFREKQNYLNMSNTAYWSKETGEDKKVGNLPTDVYQADVYRLSKPVYNFIHNEYTIAYNNALNYNNIKNDFVVWGARPSATGNIQLPCRFHLAIDKKPSLNTHTLAFYKDTFGIVRAVGVRKIKNADGEEKTLPAVGDYLFPQATAEDAKGKVYAIKTDYQSKDWREEIYYQMCEDEVIGTGENTELNNTYFQYYAELKEQFPKIYDLENQEWKQNMAQHPDQITYYLDFIDEDSGLGQYSVNNIGRRAIIEGDNNQGINCVFEPQIPDIVYIDTSQYTADELDIEIDNFTAYGQKWTQVDPGIMALMDQGGRMNSCYERIKDLLYQYTHVNNTISITTLPIYYLEPNTRITVNDDPGGIYGDYIIQSISLPLDNSSTMNINAYKALQKI